jgi:secreted PhoX family phosphatase
MDHDGMHYFPHDSDHDDDHGHRRGKRRGKRNSGLLCINHENIEPEFLLQPVLTDADKVAKMKNAHGVSVIEVRQDDGEWEVVRPSKYARRITGDTPMRISGPAAGHAMMKTSADPQGRRVLGTLNNCADGSTPWGTYLTCEENFNGYFASTDPAAITPHMRRYGVAASPFGYNWHQVDTRFDVAVEPNESNRFGWVVEIDPKRPDRKPIKHTALGRMKHENAAVVLADASSSTWATTSATSTSTNSSATAAWAGAATTARGCWRRERSTSRSSNPVARPATAAARDAGCRWCSARTASRRRTASLARPRC